MHALMRLPTSVWSGSLMRLMPLSLCSIALMQLYQHYRGDGVVITLASIPDLSSLVSAKAHGGRGIISILSSEIRGPFHKQRLCRPHI